MATYYFFTRSRPSGLAALGSIYYVLWPRDQFNKMQSCPKLYTNLEVFTMFMSVGPGHRPGVVHELGPTWPESGYNLMGLVVHAELTAHPQAITHIQSMKNKLSSHGQIPTFSLLIATSEHIIRNIKQCSF